MTSTTDWATRVRGSLPERNMNARSTAALLDNPGCVRRAVLDTARVNTEQLAKALNQPVPFGQSPFAIGQGNRFEERVKADGYAELVRVLAELGVELPDELETAKVKGFDNEARVARTRDLLRAVATGKSGAPNVIDHGMTKLMVGDHPVYLEQDAMAFRHGGRLHICEIKGFPLVDGSAQPDKVGAAARQSAVYLASIRNTLSELGLNPDIVSPRVVLICPKNYTTYPTARVIDVTRELHALDRQLERRADVGRLIADIDWTGLSSSVDASADATLEHGRALMAALDYRYQPSCMGSCDMARVCRTQAREAGSPCALGDEAANLLASTPTIALARQLADGPQSETAPWSGSSERVETADTDDVAQALRRARRAQLALAPPRDRTTAGAGSNTDIDWRLSD
jgi:hypothetical protein